MLMNVAFHFVEPLEGCSQGHQQRIGSSSISWTCSFAVRFVSSKGLYKLALYDKGGGVGFYDVLLGIIVGGWG